jgi:hypothetical protein
MIEPGDIFERKTARGATQRIVVYRVEVPTEMRNTKPSAIHFEALGRVALGAWKSLPIGMFVGAWGAPVDKMTVAGAYKLYRRQRSKNARLQAEIDRLRQQISELG